MGGSQDHVATIDSAMRRGWRPDPAVQAGVTLADLLHQGDPYGRFWTLDEPRDLAHPDVDAQPLAIAADAATTYLNSRTE